MASVSDFLSTKKLKESKSTGGTFTYFDDAGTYLVRVTSALFGHKDKVSGGKGAAYFAVENEVLTTTSEKAHLQVGRKVSMFAVDEGKAAQVYLSKIKNAIEAILDVTQEDIDEMTEDAFAKVCDELFMEQQGCVGEILLVTAVDSKNKAKEDRVYSAYSVPTDKELEARGYHRVQGVISKKNKAA